MFVLICVQSLASLEAKLESAKKAELQSGRGDRNCELKSYTGRFRRPGEMPDSGETSSHRAMSSSSSASWRKKDTRFMRPDRCETYDRQDFSRKREVPTTAAEQPQVVTTRSSEAASSQSKPRRAAESCNSFTCLMLYLTVYIFILFKL